MSAKFEVPAPREPQEERDTEELVLDVEAPLPFKVAEEEVNIADQMGLRRILLLQLTMKVNLVRNVELIPPPLTALRGAEFLPRLQCPSVRSR